jgi:hypothetical protein
MLNRREKASISIDRALTDRHLLGVALGDPTSWSRWISILRAAFALPMTDEDRALFRGIAGGREPPSHRVNELWCVVGRRSGKTRMAAAISTYIGAIEQHRLASGEVGYVLLLAASRDQARVAFDYVVGFLRSSPILRQQILSITSTEVRLKGNIIIGVHAGSYRTIRGRTLLAVVADETSFWRDETSAQPDVEIYRACMPALAASRGMWIGISTGYRKIGLLYQKWRDHFAQPGDDVLVVQGASRRFNLTLDQSIIDRAIESDPEAAESEWGGGFRSDIAAFLDEETIERCIDYARPLEVPPRNNCHYVGFVDPSGGRHDSFTLCIGHREGSESLFFVADVIRGRYPPFDPEEVVAEYAELLKQYHIHSVVGDNYSAAWAETAFKRQGINYIRSEQNKSQLYLEALPQFMRQAISLPNHPKLIRELKLLERRTTKVGRDLVDHGAHGSDDHANAFCGALRVLQPTSYDSSMKWLNDDDPEDPDGRKAWAAARLWAHINRYA